MSGEDEAPGENAAGCTLTTASAGETRRLAAALAGGCRAGDVLVLAGGLGAGKTTFAQGFAQGLGVAGPVTSPTFTLVRQYPCAGPGGIRQLVHADVFRLDSLREVADLALGELVDDGGVALIEWGDVAGPALGPSTLTVELTVADSDAAVPADGGADGADGADGAGDSRGGRPGDGQPEGRRVTLSWLGPAWAGRGPGLVSLAAQWRGAP